VIVEKVEFTPGAHPVGPVPAGPPPPTAIGKEVAVNVKPAGAFKGEPGLPD
tara:strand:- start:27 stop:179 length:153 start_codon:yes stop_codon:yes gene_type:complete